MNRVLKIAGLIVLSLILLAVIAAAALFFTTAGDYEVPATVSLDPDLPQVEIDGIKYHAQTFGDVGNPVVIVLHGGPGGDYRSLLGLQDLADEYYVVFYDQRGAGLSERVPAEQLTLQSSLEDLDKFVDLYGQGEAVNLIGHSWGGMLASAYLGYAPQKVDKAVLAEPGFLNAQEFEDWRAYQGQILSGMEYFWVALRSGFAAQHVDGPDADARNDFLLGEGILPYFTNHPNNPYHCPGEPFDAPHWRFGATASSAIPAAATEEDLNSLSAQTGEYPKPVLFLAGECDTWIGSELQAKHAALYPNAELVVIGKSGHDMFWDNPQETLTAVRAFLGQ
jgi:proline iminopeptidase